ncbi:hypothetical protein EVAR_94201_1 [Eumeta japonica]|uniref:Uncharacterized protein n=1 Tax=Eumeta variegata TaxID=151549 RepID=A0A4C1UP21_EUMVA|nr:hypothetical protein EVAR_94201_1 [Eumeta japonica]
MKGLRAASTAAASTKRGLSGNEWTMNASPSLMLENAPAGKFIYRTPNPWTCAYIDPFLNRSRRLARGRVLRPSSKSLVRVQPRRLFSLRDVVSSPAGLAELSTTPYRIVFL